MCNTTVVEAAAQGLPYISGVAMREALSPKAAAAVLADMFRAGSAAGTPNRMHVPVPGGTLLLMPAVDGSIGVKIVSVMPANRERQLPTVHAIYALFDGETGALAALFDGAALTAIRTAALSAVATDWLARPQARDLLMFGAGVQAEAHLAAICAVREIRSIMICAPRNERARVLADVAAEAHGVEASLVGQDAVARADIICTCTTSQTPVFDGSQLQPGVHVNAIGAFSAQTRELDSAAVQRSRLVVEDRRIALTEAGELTIPLAAGEIREDHICADLSQVARGEVKVRSSDSDITVFKAVGMASEDLAIATAISARLSADSPIGLGTER
jgi:ornithine cyclodeaminase